MQRQLDWVRQTLSQPKFLVITGIIYFASQITILSILSPLGEENALRLQTTFSAEEFLAIKTLWIEEDLIGQYWKHFIFDFPHPVWYALFLSACMAASFNYAGFSSGWNWLLAAPYVAAACDFIENCLHVVFLLNPELVSDLTVGISSSFTHTKWILAYSSIALYLGVLVIAFVRKRTNRGTV